MSWRGSEKHVWFISHPLGQGATGNVYLGRHKKTGEKRAVKCFNAASKDRPANIQTREFEVMRKVEHKNIVKFYDVENESQSKEPVIIMELCKGGSLHNIIETPENGFGMEEKEFLTMTIDVTSGLRYLHQSRIIHRDLKPGNILKAIASDGSSVFKLTDFGAAKILEPDNSEEQFMSLYGTEEYLYPEMFAKAVLKKHTVRHFSSKVDLYSVGVTFYHAATGNLPFRPYGGRKNRVTMYDITQKKPSGAISGVQEHENGMIEYSDRLPSTCQISIGLQQLVTPLLAQLMEVQPAKQWNFEDYFKAVDQLKSFQKVTVFSTVTCEYLCVYLEPHNRLCHLQEALAAQTLVNASNQCLFYNCVPLQELFIGEDVPISQYPPTSQDYPIILVAKDVVTREQKLICDVPSIPRPQSPSNLLTDYAFSKQASALSAFLQKKIRYSVQYQGLLLNIISMLWMSVLTPQISRVQGAVETFCNSWVEKSKAISYRLSVKERTMQQLHQLQYSDARLQDNCQSLINNIKNAMAHISDGVGQLQLMTVPKDVASYVYSFTERSCKDSSNCIQQASALNEHIVEAQAEFRRDKSMKQLNYNEEQIHKYERQRLTYVLTKMRSLFEGHCHVNLQKVHSLFCDKLRGIWSHVQNLELFQLRLNKLTLLCTDIQNWEEQLESLLSTEQSRSTMPVPPPEPRSNASTATDDDEGFGTCYISEDMKMPVLPESRSDPSTVTELQTSTDINEVPQRSTATNEVPQRSNAINEVQQTSSTANKVQHTNTATTEVQHTSTATKEVQHTSTATGEVSNISTATKEVQNPWLDTYGKQQGVDQIWQHGIPYSKLPERTETTGWRETRNIGKQQSSSGSDTVEDNNSQVANGLSDPSLNFASSSGQDKVVNKRLQYLDQGSSNSSLGVQYPPSNANSLLQSPQNTGYSSTVTPSSLAMAMMQHSASSYSNRVAPMSPTQPYITSSASANSSPITPASPSHRGLQQTVGGGGSLDRFKYPKHLELNEQVMELLTFNRTVLHEAENNISDIATSDEE